MTASAVFARDPLRYIYDHLVGLEGRLVEARGRTRSDALRTLLDAALSEVRELLDLLLPTLDPSDGANG